MYDRAVQGDKWWGEAGDEVRKDYGKDFFNMPMRGKYHTCIAHCYVEVRLNTMHVSCVENKDKRLCPSDN